MSMPITFTAPVDPASPVPGGVPADGESGALFGIVLSGLFDAADDGSAEGDTSEESTDAMSAAAPAPLGGELLVGLNLPIGDARALTTATGSSASVSATLPTLSTSDPAAATPPTTAAQAGPANPGVPSTPTGTLSAQNAPLTQVPPLTQVAPPTGLAPPTHVPPPTQVAPPTGLAPPTQVPQVPLVPQVGPDTPAPVPPAAQAAAGAAAAAGLTGTLAGSVAGTTAPGTTAAPGTQRIAPDPVARTTAPAPAGSTVDPGGTGSTVYTAVRSGSGSGSGAADSGQDRGNGQFTRGPENAWVASPGDKPTVAVPTLAIVRADAATPTTPAATASPLPLPPAAQLALRLAPLRTGPDGTHQLTIVLHPENLGPVSVVATVKGDQLSVQLTGATDAGRDALRAALPELERDLREGGFTALTLNVRETPHPDPVRPAWAGTATTPQPTTQQPTTPQPTTPQPTTPQPTTQQPTAPQPAQQQAPVAPTVSPTATEHATDGTATTTAGTKTDSQPIGQILQPDGAGPIRRDDSTGQYNPAGAVAAATQSSGAQFGGTGQQSSQQQPTQLNLGQPGNPSGQQPSHPGLAEHQHTGGGRQHQEGGTGAEPDAGRPIGHSGPGEPDPRAAEHRPDRTGTRSVDLRV